LKRTNNRRRCPTRQIQALTGPKHSPGFGNVPNIESVVREYQSRKYIP
jgi:hypothetical protein